MFSSSKQNYTEWKKILNSIREDNRMDKKRSKFEFTSEYFLLSFIPTLDIVTLYRWTHFSSFQKRKLENDKNESRAFKNRRSATFIDRNNQGQYEDEKKK